MALGTTRFCTCPADKLMTGGSNVSERLIPTHIMSLSNFYTHSLRDCLTNLEVKKLGRGLQTGPRLSIRRLL